MPALKSSQQLKRVATTIDSLNKCCEDMKKHVNAARQESAPVIEEASTLLGQKQELESKRQLLDAFNKHFIIPEEDMLVLTTSAEMVDERFFAILRRVKQIYVDCQLLLGSENQRLGLELMDQNSKTLNLGYQKLYKWIQKELKNLDLENPQISSIIRRALRALAERPTLFQSCLDFFAEAREHILTDAFYAALTGLTAGNDHNLVAKPIDFHTYDPLRYVGDMLAWTHSTTVSEREALETLFISEGDEIGKGFKAGIEAEPWTAEDGEAFDGRRALGDLVNRNLAGVARALRQRVEQVLQNHEDPILLYKIANLVKFYRATFDKLLGIESSLLETMTALEESSLRQFRHITSDNLSAIQADPPVMPADLRIPDFFEETLSQFSALLKTYDSSLAPTSTHASDFDPIFSQALAPFLAECKKMAKDVEEPSKSIFLANCFLATKSTLSTHDFVQDRESEVDEQLESTTFVLIEYQHAFFLHTSGLHPLLAALAPLDDSQDSLATIPTLSPFHTQALTDASQSLDDFLPSALMNAMENLKQLSSTKVAQEITAEAAERFCENFEFVEGKLGAFDELRAVSDEEDAEGKADDVVPLKSLFPRTSGEIRVLLS